VDIKYEILRSCDVYILEEYINNNLSEGWQLKGDLFIAKGAGINDEDLYCQPMILEQECDCCKTEQPQPESEPVSEPKHEQESEFFGSSALDHLNGLPGLAFDVPPDVEDNQNGSEDKSKEEKQFIDIMDALNSAIKDLKNNIKEEKIEEESKQDNIDQNYIDFFNAIFGVDPK
jgi:hypothetical protein